MRIIAFVIQDFVILQLYNILYDAWQKWSAKSKLNEIIILLTCTCRKPTEVLNLGIFYLELTFFVIMIYEDRHPYQNWLTFMITLLFCISLCLLEKLRKARRKITDVELHLSCSKCLPWIRCSAMKWNDPVLCSVCWLCFDVVPLFIFLSLGVVQLSRKKSHCSRFVNCTKRQKQVNIFWCPNCVWLEL